MLLTAASASISCGGGNRGCNRKPTALLWLPVIILLPCAVMQYAAPRRVVAVAFRRALNRYCQSRHWLVGHMVHAEKVSRW